MVIMPIEFYLWSSFLLCFLKSVAMFIWSRLNAHETLTKLPSRLVSVIPIAHNKTLPPIYCIRCNLTCHIRNAPVSSKINP